MTTHTDRIKQMAQEAGFPSMAVENMSQHDLERLTRFAQLVAEDCAMVVDAAMEQENVCTKDAPSDAIRARYSLKD